MTEQHSLKMTLNLTGHPQGHPVSASALIKHVPEGERPPSLEHSPALVICQSRNVGNKKTLFLPLGCEQPRGAGGEGIPSTCAQILHLLMRRCSEPRPWAQSWVWSCSESPLATRAGSSRDPGVAWLWGLCSCATRGSWSRGVATGNPGRSSPRQGEPLLSSWSIVQLQLLLQGVGICTGVTLWIIKCQNMKL